MTAPRIPKSHRKNLSHSSYAKKTKMCSFFQVGCCRRGDQCKYAHLVAKLEPVPHLTKTSLCAGWLKNRCPHTDAECHFAHGEQDLRRSVSSRKAEIIIEPKPVGRVGKATDLSTFIAPSSPPVVAESVGAKHPWVFDDGDVFLPLPSGNQVILRKPPPITAFLAIFVLTRRPSERLSLVQLASVLQQSKGMCDDHVLERCLRRPCPKPTRTNELPQ